VHFHLTIPARINLLGNPSDANEGDFATISAAVNVYAGALVEPSTSWKLEIAPRSSLPGLHIRPSCLQGSPGETLPQSLEFSPTSLPLPYDGQLDLLKGALNRLYAFSPELRSKLPQQGFRILAWSDVPRQSGLGGSSLLVTLALAALRQFYDLDRLTHNDYILCELTQNVEALELGITCGFADRYVPFFGGLAYLDYRGKLHQAPIRMEPLVTYERLDHYVERLPLVAITTGVQHNSGDVHGRMRPRYIQEYDAWSGAGGEPPPLVRTMQGIYATAWRGKIALLEGDLASFGALMNTNHRLIDAMMTHCGFVDGAGWANNLFIKVALDNGALGAKLTGAGGGGSVFALVSPGNERRLVQAWQQTVAQTGLTHAHIYQPSISPLGLKIDILPSR
jgi:galactokinase/mevalonate kinase-like predicted kinase